MLEELRNETGANWFALLCDGTYVGLTGAKVMGAPVTGPGS
jgi:hypothetical protein